MSANPPTLILVRRRKEPDYIAALIDSCRKRAASSGYNTVVRYCIDSRLEGAGRSRPVRLLEPNDAHRLYVALHAGPVLVLSFQRVYVRRDPSRNPPAKRIAIDLEDFVRFKGAFGLVMEQAHVAEAFERFEDWCATLGCTGEDDPRALPFHVFRTSYASWPRLGERSTDREFQRRHGSAGRRRDDGGSTWTRAARGAYHGSPTLHVARAWLTAGMHWDVTATTRKATIHAANAIWRLPRPDAWLSIYPNGSLRRARDSTARQVWPQRPN
jgi:hypothetical protein